MGTIKTTNIETITGSGTLTLGQSGETITIPSGVTVTNNGTQTGFGGTNTPAFLASLTANQTITNATYTKVQLDNEILDTDNCYDNSTNYRFTPTTAGYYWLFASGRFDAYGGNTPHRHIIRKNNISASQIQAEWSNVTATQFTVSGIHYANGSTDYFEYFVSQSTGSSQPFNGGTWFSGEIARFGGYKIIE